MRRMTAMMVQSDLPLFDDVKKGESYLMRETPYFVYLYFVLLDILWTCVLCVLSCYGHVFCGHVLVV